MPRTAQGCLAELISTMSDRGLTAELGVKAELKNIHQLLLKEKNHQTSYNPSPDLAIDPAYVKLDQVLARAYDQAAGGKGKDRHVKSAGQKFEDQPICSLQRIYGSGYAFGQVGKKMEESMRLPKERAVAELLGAINYIAAAVIVIEEGEQ